MALAKRKKNIKRASPRRGAKLESPNGKVGKPDG